MAAKTIRVGIINGSLRKDSNNSGLGRIVQEVKPANVEFIHLRIDDLPLFNEDLQVFTDGGKTVTLPETVNRIRQAVRGLDALVFTSPENNGSLSAPLKNAYDWLSRDYERFGSTNTSPVAGKKLGVIGASYISDIAIIDVKKIVEYLKVNVYTQTFYTKLGPNFNAEGNLTNNEQKTRLINWANGFYTWVQA